jgi:NTE family protein
MDSKNSSLKQITLVLGSGGARGLCYIGVLKALEEIAIPIGKIIGCSMGSIIGAAYCSGISLQEIEKYALTLKIRNFLSFSPFSSALFSHRGFEKVVSKIVPTGCFESLKIPLKIVCTDLEKGESVVFESGPLFPPIVGSCLTAGLFEPVSYENYFLVDGGYLNPVPVNITSEDDIVIAIDSSLRPDYSIRTSLKKDWKNFFKISKPWRQALKSSDMLCYTLSQSQGKGIKHLRIIPNFIDMPFISFRDGKNAIEIGRNSVYEHIEEIKQFISSKA